MKVSKCCHKPVYAVIKNFDDSITDVSRLTFYTVIGWICSGCRAFCEIVEIKEQGNDKR